MIVNGLRPIHPGEILREEFLLPLGLSVNALAKALHVPATRVHEIVKENRSIRPTRLCALPVILAVMLNRGLTCKPNMT